MAWDNIISRGIWVIVQPSNFLMLTLTISIVLYKISNKNSKIRKISNKIIPICLTVLFVAGFTNLPYWALVPLENRFHKFVNQLDNGPYSGIIVLGGSEILPVSSVTNQAALNDSGERLITAASLAINFPDLPIIHSGGTRYETYAWSDNDVAKKVFEDVGIDMSRVRFVDNSYNTHTNATEARNLIEDNETRPWLLVTSAFHMPRSVGAFRHAGIKFQPYPVDYKTTLKYSGLFSFDFAKNLFHFDWAIHEYIGLLAYYVTGRSSDLFPAP